MGNVGARERINYTLVGAVANQASRLEGLNKVYGTEILASGAVADATADRFVWRHIDRIVAAGTTEMLDIHEPLGERSTEAEHAAFLAQWDAGRAAYLAGCFEAAIVCFRAAAALRRRWAEPPVHGALRRTRPHRPARRLGWRLALRPEIASMSGGEDMRFALVSKGKERVSSRCNGPSRARGRVR